ncbi:hypothetical protein BC829DRAFT_389744 [Chytridium lagenaria]|nr:hypothetical protein BC829DRAFT_389744 [Chytridium lagenaria]
MMPDRSTTMMSDQINSPTGKGRFSNENELMLVATKSSAISSPYMLHLVSGRLLTSYPPSDTKSKFLQEKLLGTKVTFATSSGVPLSLFSVIPHMDNTRDKAKRSRARSLFGARHCCNANLFSSNLFRERVGVGVMEPFKRKSRVESYARLLFPSNFLGPQIIENSLYNPFFLDDPELKTGKHKTVITLPCFVASIIQYSRAADIKRELNEHFRETHPTVDSTLTLSQIRSLKAKLLEVSSQANLELSTVASSYVFFEKLVLKYLCTAVCLLLASKVNDPKETNYGKLLEIMDKVLEVSQESIYAELEFNLFLPLWEILPHLHRVIDASNFNSLDEYCEGRTFFASHA